MKLINLITSSQVFLFRLLSILILTFCITYPSLSQITFEKYYGNMDEDIGQSIIQTSDLGYLISGTNTNFYFGIPDIYIIKTNINGDTIWTKTIGEPDKYDFATSCIETTDGEYIVCGYSEDTIDTFNTRVIKLDADGNLIWDYNTYEENDNYLMEVKQADTSSIITVGYIMTFSKNQKGYFEHPIIQKISLSGDLIWRKVYTADINLDYAKGIEKTTDGGFIVFGSYNLDGPNHAPYLMKINEEGNEQWIKLYSGAAFRDITRTPDNHFLIGGIHSEGIIPSQSDMTLLKIDSAGNTIWHNYYGSELSESCSEVKISEDNQYVLCGSTSTVGNGSDFILKKIDTDGEEIWSETYGGSLAERAYSLVATNDGGYAICGETNSYGNGSYDVFVVKTTGEGIMTSLNNLDIEQEILCYPNPSIGNLIIKASEEIELIKIYNYFGLEVFEEQTNSKQVNINNSGLIPGVYFIKIQTSKLNQTKKIIIK